MNWFKFWMCKRFHKSHHRLIVWDDGSQKVEKIRCYRCEEYVDMEHWSGGQCLNCSQRLINAYFTRYCSECRKKVLL